MKKRTFTPISVLIGVLLLALAAAMTTFVADSDIAHAQSADTTLSALTVVGQPTANPSPPDPPTGVDAYSTLSPTLKSNPNDSDWTTEYDVRIPFVQTAVLVTVRPNDHGIQNPNTDTSDDARVTVNGTAAAIDADLDGDFTRTVNVSPGVTTTLTIAVTSTSGTSTRNYTVKVYRESSQTRSDNANLTSLSLSGGSLSPGFSASEILYDARIQSNSTTVAYTLSDNNGGASAAITAPSACSGGSTTNCTDGKKVYLRDEANTTPITVVVTPESGSDDNKTYTINVYRIRVNPSTNANLRDSNGLTISTVGSNSGFVGAANAGAVYNGNDAVKTSSKVRVNNNTDYVTVATVVADAGATAAVRPSDATPATPNSHEVALTAGRETTITVTVTAEDPARKKAYTVTVYRERATKLNNNNLTALSLNAGTWSPAFSSGETQYNVQVAHTVNKVTVSYTAGDTSGGSSVQLAVGNTDQDSKEVTLGLAGSTTTITATVTPECGTNVTTDPVCSGDKVYTITVYRLRSAPSASATLGALTVTPGTLVPAFSATDVKSMYNVDMDNANSTITVNATAANAANGATIVISPNGGKNVALTAGAETTITLTVTAEDRTTTGVFKVVVYRYRAERSDDATLSALSLSAGTLDPAFDSDKVEYKARVANDVGKVTVSRTLSDNAGGASAVVATSTDADCSTTGDNTTVTGDVTLNGGGNNTNICVLTTAEDGTANKSYLITVYRERANFSEDASLTAFTIEEVTGTLSASLDIDPTTVAVDPGNQPISVLDKATQHVIYRVRAVTVETTADLGAMVEIMPVDSDNAKMGHQVNLTAGAATDITVTVQAEDPTVPAKEHKVSVYRRNVPGSESDDATLKSLSLSGAVLTPEFDPATTKYTAAAAFSTTATTVAAEANHAGAIVALPTDEESAATDPAGVQVKLTAGVVRSIQVTVTSESEVGKPSPTTKTYTVEVTRAAEAGTDATLSSLSLTDGAGMDIALTPAFDPATAAYTASVDSTVTAANVMAMAAAPGTTVEVMYGADDMEVTAGDDGSYSVPLTEGANTVKVMVTAEDAETTMTYTVTVTVSPADPSLALYDEYDTDDNNMIDKSEVVAAIEAYLQHGTLTKAEVVTLIQKYLSGEPIRE